jgi:MEMO1 family protein
VSNPMRTVAPPRSRPPAVSGMFYDADPHRLSAEVRRLLATAGQAPTTRRPEAIIAPHAGYAYSGEVAATAFKVLEPFAETLRRVVLIGPAHYVPFTGMVFPTTSSFETPLGPVPLDLKALGELSAVPAVRAADEPHAPEHSLEVELPFLQTILPRFTLVPILIGDASPHEVADVLGRVWNGPETVAVVSSDLSHFHEYESARRQDARTAAMVEAGCWQDLGPGEACGYLAIAGLLLQAPARGLKAQRLSLQNSGDTAGPRNSVVGYGAWLFGR